MTRRVNIGLIGCGSHSQEVLVPALAELAGAQVVTVCDSNTAAASQAKQRLGAVEIESDFMRLIERAEIDAIVVAATPQIHFRAAMAGIARGLHIFVEKPPTVSGSELAELAECASKVNLVTCVGHNLRHSDAAVQMQLLLGKSRESAKSFGNPVAIEMRYLASKPIGDRWNLGSPIKSFLLSHANHAIDFMVFQMGPIKCVNAALASTDGNGVALSAQFVFRSGAVGNLLATSFAPHFSISGSILSDKKQVVQLNSLNEIIGFGFDGDEKRWGRIWTGRTLLTGYESAGYLRELQSFVDAILEGKPESCSPSFKEELSVYDAIEEIERIVSHHSASKFGL